MKLESLHGFKTILVAWPIMWALAAVSAYAIKTDPSLAPELIKAWAWFIVAFGLGYGSSKLSDGARDKMRRQIMDRATEQLGKAGD